MAYIIEIQTSLTTMDNRTYFSDTYTDCTEPEAWAFCEDDAYEFSTTKEAEEKAKEIEEAFKKCEVNVTCQVNKKTTFDIVFNDGEKSDRKGWHETFSCCQDYIETYNGTDESYFADYKGGVVSIVNNVNNDVVREYDID